MAFTGDLEHLNLVDIIQLVHTTRKSGIFSVKAARGESKIVFSGGYIVGANHIDNRVRIGTVLVKTGAITVEDLKEALVAAKGDVKDHMPLIATLMRMGRLKREDALRGLKTLVEMTIVELMNWTKGTFTFDTDMAVFAAGAGDMEQDVALDAQMVLMDALRIFDERERDRAAGKEVPSFEALFADVLPEEDAGGAKAAGTAITADVLGLGDLENLEKKISRPVSEMEIFDPVAIHRQNIREMLADFPAEEQEAFVSFLKKSVGHKSLPDAASQQADRAVVLFSDDRLMRHSVLTLCKDEGVPVFATDDGADLVRIIAKCLSAMRMPVVVFDGPGGGFSGETIVSLRDRVRGAYPAVPVVQLAAPGNGDFILRAYQDGVRAVLPKPAREDLKETFVRDTIQFLGAFQSYIKNVRHRSDDTDRYVKELKKDIRTLREIATPSDAAMVLLASVGDKFERAVTFIVRPAELIGERAVGVSSEKSMGPTPADRLKVSLARPSVFRDVLEKGQAYYGESGDEAIKGLFQVMGRPVSPSVILLPLVCDRKVVAVVYGDFGKKEASPVQLDILEILAVQVGISLEYALFRRQVAKASPKG